MQHIYHFSYYNIYIILIFFFKSHLYITLYLLSYVQCLIFQYIFLREFFFRCLLCDMEASEYFHYASLYRDQCLFLVFQPIFTPLLYLPLTNVVFS